jgi:hypothetical protein
MPHDVPTDLIGIPLERARTMPGRWYSDPAHHERELDAGANGSALDAPMTSPTQSPTWRRR